MSYIAPFIRHMLLCDDVVDSGNKVSIVNLLHKTGPKSGGHYPFVLPLLSVYVVMTGGRGQATVQIAGRQDQSGQKVFTSPSHRIRIPGDPLQVAGMIMRVRDIRFVNSGLYWVELLINDVIMHREPLILR